MHKGIDRINILDPSLLFNNIDIDGIKEEVKIRRLISSMYMAIFNYWVAIERYKKNNQGDGRSNEPDDFTYVHFERKISNKYSRDISYLAKYRVICDHRVNNPANYKKGGKSINLYINHNSLMKSYCCFNTLINAIKNNNL